MNHKLPPMNTNHRSIPLQSGQALSVGRHGSATLFLVEGEVLLQAPAEWLGDMVFQAPSRRVAAPAVFTGSEIHTLTALGTATIQIEEAPGLLEKFKSAWQGRQSPASACPVGSR